MIVAPSTSKPLINFQDIPELRSDGDREAIIFGIRTHTADTVPNTATGNPVATFDQLTAGFLTLYVLGSKKFFQIPLINFLVQAGNGASYFYTSGIDMDFNPVRIDWTLSYISWPVPLNNDTQFSYYFTVWYEWCPVGSYQAYLKNQSAQWINGIFK